MKKRGFLFFTLLALSVGTLSGYFARTGLETVYPLLEKSPLTPPGALFPVVWTVLYLLMGIGLALVLRRVGTEHRTAFVLWCVQLALNAAWSLLFFGAGAYLGALICLCLLWVSIFLMMMVFDSASPAAAWLQVPYFLLVSYAGYLNLVIWRLNP